MACAFRQTRAHDVAEVSGVMRPRLPLIRSRDPITGASASDRGWIRECFPDLRSHFSDFLEAARAIRRSQPHFWKLLAQCRRSQLHFRSCSRDTTLAASWDLLTCGLALSLLVPRIFANHHHATVPANHLALVADPLDARLDFHRASF